MKCIALINNQIKQSKSDLSETQTLADSIDAMLMPAERGSR